MSIFDEVMRRIMETRAEMLPMPRPEIPTRVHAVSYDPLRGLPVIVLGRDPPFIGHYLYHVPERYDGRWYWRIYTGFVEIWARVYDRAGRPVADYPYLVHGLPTVGAYVAWQHARDVGGRIRLYAVGITDPIDQVLVPEDSILFLDRVFEGRFRTLIVDAAGVRRAHVDYDTARELAQLHDLVARYAENVHILDRELRTMRIMYSIKDVEVSKYRMLIDELQTRLLSLAGTLERMRYEVERLRQQLEYWELTGEVRAELARSAIQGLNAMQAQLKNALDLMAGIAELMSTRIGKTVEEAIRYVRAPPKPEEKPAEMKPAAKGYV